ncbi:hypothetical protein OAJ77_03155 [Rhodospirillales bacterium]|nr:hypothetical protein [Rhodospirillales bacterium]
MTKKTSNFGLTSPEIGRMLHMDHVNFETPDHEMATIFYMNGLGFTRDPYRRADEQNLGVNVGRQQFHLPKRGEYTPPFYGIVGLVVPDIGGIKQRFEILNDLGKFEGTPYDWLEEGNTVLMTSPFGYRLRLHSCGTLEFTKPLGIAYVEVPAPLGKAARIGKFYEKIVGAPVQISAVGGTEAAIISAGPHQEIKFIERELDDYDTYSMHISYHVTHYNELRQRLNEHGSLMGLGGGEAYFFNKIFDPETGEILMTFQNEVRSVYHPDFMRPLINRWPMNDEPFTDHTTAMREFAKSAGFMPGKR